MRVVIPDCGLEDAVPKSCGDSFRDEMPLFFLGNGFFSKPAVAILGAIKEKVADLVKGHGIKMPEPPEGQFGPPFNKRQLDDLEVLEVETEYSGDPKGFQFWDFRGPGVQENRHNPQWQGIPGDPEKPPDLPKAIEENSVFLCPGDIPEHLFDQVGISTHRKAKGHVEMEEVKTDILTGLFVKCLAKGTEKGARGALPQSRPVEFQLEIPKNGAGLGKPTNEACDFFDMSPVACVGTPTIGENLPVETVPRGEHLRNPDEEMGEGNHRVGREGDFLTLGGRRKQETRCEQDGRK